jgi:flagellar protein FlbD
MIKLTRLNGKEIYINANLIKFIEATPNTLLWLSDGDRINVLESPQAVAEAAINYQREAHSLPTLEKLLNDKPKETE